ncbi:MAG: hypothetical protein AB8H86_32720 [Polyangiales bacterium]
MGRAKGSNMHHMRTWVVANHGRPAWTSLLESMSTEDRLELLGLVPVGWYELALQHRLLRSIDDFFGTGDGSLIDVIGVFEANQDLKRIHRLFLSLANPAYVLEKSGDYWSRFYDTGEWTVVRLSPNSARGRLTGVEPFTDEFCRYLSAYIGQMWVLVGAKHLTQETTIERSGFTIVGRWR